MNPYEGIPSEDISLVRDTVDKRWKEVKDLRESGKAPSELDRYFKALNTTKLRPETVDDAIDKLEQALEHDDNLKARDRQHLRQYLDRPFDREENHEYATLPKRKVSTVVDVPWTIAKEPPNDLADLFPNGLGLGQRKCNDQWRPRKVEITRKMVRAGVVKDYLTKTGTFAPKEICAVRVVAVEPPGVEQMRIHMAALLRKVLKS